MQDELADINFFVFCDFTVKTKSVNTDYEFSFVKAEILRLRFLDLTFLSFELFFHVFEFFFFGTCVHFFVIDLLEFGLFFLHLFFKVMKDFSVVFDFDCVLVEEFFLEVRLDGES